MLSLSCTFINAQETIIFVTPYDDAGPHDLYNREVENIHFLEDQGFIVQKFWPPNRLGAVSQDTIDMLNAADLVILGRAGQSVNFQDEVDRLAWNGLTSPQLLINMWFARSNRLKWFNSTDCEHYNDGPPVAYATILEPGDTIFSGVALVDDSVDWFSPPPHDFIRLDSSTNGEILATWDDNAILIARFAAGVPFYVGTAETSDAPAGPRSFIGMGNNAVTDVYNFFPLTINGKAVYLAEIYRMLGQPVKAPLYSPSDISLSNSLLFNNEPAGTFIGLFTSSDLTEGDTHVYDFATGTGDDDNASFQIRVDSLFSDEVADYYTKSDYSIRVRSTDLDDLFIEEEFQINVWPDTLTGVSSYAGEIYRDMVWSADTVKVTGDIIITDGAILTIDPGCCIEFQGYYKLDIYNGTVIAEGNVEDTIVFTIHDNTGFGDLYSPTGGWQGIIMDDHGQMPDVDTSLFEHCIFEYAKGTSSRSWDKGGAFFIDRTELIRIENCVIRNNSCYTSGGGIGLGEAAHISIRNSFIHNNKAFDGGGIDVGKACRASIEHNVFYNNTALNYGGGIFSHPGAAFIINNIISNNYAGYQGGGIYTHKSFNTFLGNLIVNNEAAQDGGGMLIHTCSPDIINNTICFNKADTGSAIMFPYTGTPNIVNSIFWGNSSTDNAQINLGTLGMPDIRYSLLEGGLDSIKMGPDHNYYGIYSENLAADPLFTDPSLNAGLADDGMMAKWDVEGASPCLNSGSNDLAGRMLEFDDVYQNNRLQYSIIDMGAVETNIPEHIAETEITSNTSWIADSIFVNGDIYIRDSATLTISPGAVVVFKGYYGIFNEGVLHAVGTKENMIKFTVYNTDGSSNLWSSSGNWKGITISNSIAGKEGQMWDNDTTRIDYCILEYANAYPIGESGGALRITNFSKIIISNSILRYNMAQEKGGAINLTSFSDLVIKNNIFHDNYTENTGGGITIYTNSEPLILNNIFSNNTALGQGGGISVYQADPILINNVICNNTALKDGGVRLSQANAVFINNTIVNNLVQEGGSGGLNTNNCSPDIINCVFWGNVDNAGSTQIKVNENPSFYNCVIENVSDGGLIP